jgi:hypothetical protein
VLLPLLLVLSPPELLRLRAYDGPLEPNLAAPVVAAPAPGPGAEARARVLAMEAAYRGVRDYTATLLKQERVKGKLMPRETIRVKFRKPYSLYMTWTGGVYRGREALYVRGQHGGKLVAHQGSFPDLTVELDPKGAMAMRGNRHPITEASLGEVVALVVRDLRRSEARPEDRAALTDLGEQTRAGERLRCVDARFPAGGYYAPHVQICVFAGSNLPARIQAWDAREQLLEDYEYRDLRTNVGLRDLDFDRSNPAYNF